MLTIAIAAAASVVAFILVTVVVLAVLRPDERITDIGRAVAIAVRGRME